MEWKRRRVAHAQQYRRFVLRGKKGDAFPARNKRRAVREARKASPFAGEYWSRPGLFPAILLVLYLCSRVGVPSIMLAVPN